MKSFTRSIVGPGHVISAIRSPYYMECLGYRSKYSNIYQQNRLAARATGRTSGYIGIAIHCLSVFRLGRVFVLFSRLVRLTYPHTSRRGSATANFARQTALHGLLTFLSSAFRAVSVSRKDSGSVCMATLVGTNTVYPPSTASSRRCRPARNNVRYLKDRPTYYHC